MQLIMTDQISMRQSDVMVVLCRGYLRRPVLSFVRQAFLKRFNNIFSPRWKDGLEDEKSVLRDVKKEIVL
jgi:hypothetical protein